MYKFILLFYSIFLINSTFAQQVVFYNSKLNKSIVVKSGSKVFLGYRGYNGNTEFASNTVTDITDSTITIGLDMSYWLPNRKPSAVTNNFKVIRLKDITHFRKRSLAGEMIKNILQIGGAVGSVYLLSDLYRNERYSQSNAVLISIGAGLVLNSAAKVIFPENAKYRIQDGWIINPTPNNPSQIKRN
jgi:hypothetical protein